MLIQFLSTLCQRIYQSSLHFTLFVHDFLNYVNLAIWGAIECKKKHHLYVNLFSYFIKMELRK